MFQINLLCFFLTGKQLESERYTTTVVKGFKIIKFTYSTELKTPLYVFLYKWKHRFHIKTYTSITNLIGNSLTQL